MRRGLGLLRTAAAIGLALLCLDACGRRPAPMRIRYADLSTSTFATYRC